MALTQRTLQAAPVLSILLFAACSTPAPSLRPVAQYENLNCDQLSHEYRALDKAIEIAQSEQKDESSSLMGMLGVLAIAGGAASAGGGTIDAGTMSSMSTVMHATLADDKATQREGLAKEKMYSERQALIVRYAKIRGCTLSAL